MITIKFFGGAKKSFGTDKLTIDKTSITIAELLTHLTKIKPENLPDLDVNNLLIAINGVDSSAINGKSTILQPDDVVSIIPIIHGGSLKRIQFSISNKTAELMLVNDPSFGEKFLVDLRKKFPDLVIQGISEKFVLSESHAKKILFISFLAQKKQILLSKKLETDILMRFAGTTQISQAIKTVGIQKGKKFFIIASGRKTVLQKLYNEIFPHLSSIDFSNNQIFLQRFFGIKQKQLDSVISKSPLEDLLVERSSILF